MIEGELQIMGSGGSMGIPVIGCHCAVCTSSNPYNTRTRSTALIKAAGKKILVDVGPDFRQQALKYCLNSFDALMVTHAHQDHVGGIDDLRPFFFYRTEPLPVFMSRETFSDLEARFPYIFNPMKKGKSLVPRLSVQILEEERGDVNVAGIPFQIVTYSQLGMKVNGFRIGDLGYVSDIKDFPETIYEDLKGIKTLIVSALRHETNSFHFTVDEAVAFARKVGAEKTWLTHIAHELDHQKTDDSLPSDIRMAYDGLQIPFIVV